MILLVYNCTISWCRKFPVNCSILPTPKWFNLISSISSYSEAQNSCCPPLFSWFQRNDIFHPTQAWEKAPQAAERDGFFTNRFGRMKGKEIWEKHFRKCNKVTKKVRRHWPLLPLWSISFPSSWVKMSDVFIWPKTLGNADEIRGLNRSWSFFFTGLCEQILFVSWWTMTKSWNPYD